MFMFNKLISAHEQIFGHYKKIVLECLIYIYTKFTTIVRNLQAYFMGKVKYNRTLLPTVFKENVFCFRPPASLTSNLPF